MDCQCRSEDAAQFLSARMHVDDGCARRGQVEQRVALRGDFAHSPAENDHEIGLLHSRNELRVGAEAEIAREEIDPIIAEALSEAGARGITGKAVTPFLLQRIFELTQGRSLAANIALVLNNARLAAAIARCLSES